MFYYTYQNDMDATQYVYIPVTSEYLYPWMF